MYRGMLLAVLLLVLMWAIVWPVETELECKGKIPTPSGPAPATMYVDMKLPRWGLDMFGRPKGSLLVSMPGEVAVRYEVVDSFHGRIDVGREDGLGGTYTESTGQIALRIPQGSFSGTCQELH